MVAVQTLSPSGVAALGRLLPEDEVSSKVLRYLTDRTATIEDVLSKLQDGEQPLRRRLSCFHQGF